MSWHIIESIILLESDEELHDQVETPYSTATKDVTVTVIEQPMPDWDVATGDDANATQDVEIIPSNKNEIETETGSSEKELRETPPSTATEDTKVFLERLFQDW